MSRSTWRQALASVLLLIASGGAVHAGATLYDRIGGEAKLRGTVEQFVKIILEDDRINFTFAEADLDKFKQLLFEQLCELTRGPCKYTGRDMHTAHAKLNLTQAQFNALAEDLYRAFDREHVSYRVQNQVMALLAPMQNDIVKPGFVAPGTQPPPRNVR